MMMGEPEPLHLCGVVILVDGRRTVTAGIRLRSCPGLAVTETQAGWVVAHDALALDTPGDSPGARRLTPADFAAPWAEAVRHMRALATMNVDWMQRHPLVRRTDLPPLGEGWMLAESVERRRCA